MATKCSAAFPCPVGPSVDADDNDICWICLDGDSPEKPLELPCRCPRKVHLACLARWQLQSAGRNEEDRCRFCQAQLPDWKTSLTPNNVKPVVPVMAIKFEGKTYKLKVKPGPEGLREFQQQVRELLGFDITDEFDVTFECQIPHTGEKMKLTGLNSYGAATHCAAITAAQREVKPSRHHKTHSANPSRSHSSAVPSADVDHQHTPILNQGSSSGHQLRATNGTQQYPQTTLLHSTTNGHSRQHHDAAAPAANPSPRGDYRYRSRSMPDIRAGDDEASGSSNGGATTDVRSHGGSPQPYSSASVTTGMPVQHPQTVAVASGTVRLPLLSKTAQMAKEKISKLFAVLDLSKP